MARKQTAQSTEMPRVSICGERIWLCARYHAHVFHYRMPETVAVASVSPFVPSPLTVKLALVAALARYGDIEGAQQLTDYLPYLNAPHLRIVPPEGAVAFKAFIRYVRPPDVRSEEALSQRDGNTGGFYAVSPHIREYALWQGELRVAVHAPVEAVELMERALWRVTYLGAKDSQVTCWEVTQSVDLPADLEDLALTAVRTAQDIPAVRGPIFRLVDLAGERAPTLERLIPFQRRTGRGNNDYVLGFYTLPGELHASGRARIYYRKDRADAVRTGDRTAENQ
ncbi:MAG: hypothetical protein RMJ43_15765 [Chloroherpetonaceae bacterium]|nr:hypothetical protein [Chthonomonadaceae bacterium]MDW8209291.1 hypothetical protein [Chloroherpetonaceae bacterium]